MAEQDVQFKGKIKQAGIFNFKDFYSFAYDWLREEDYDVIEKTYSEKVIGDSKDLQIIWECQRKISDYFKFLIKMTWSIWGLKKIKVKKEGKETTMDTGLIEIKFQAILIKDYENRWENHPFWKFLKGMYDRYIIRARIEEYEDKLLAEVNELIVECKSFLAIEAQQST